MDRQATVDRTYLSLDIDEIETRWMKLVDGIEPSQAVGKEKFAELHNLFSAAVAQARGDTVPDAS